MISLFYTLVSIVFDQPESYTMKKWILLLTVGSLVWGCHKPVAPVQQQAVATAHPIATQAGMDILNQGGNAFDAAVAVSATLAVVEPYSSGIGGGGFWLLYRHTDKHTVMLDGREVAPNQAHRDMYLNANGEVDSARSINGPLAAGIPGEPAALDYLARKYGRLPLATSLAPAIRAAQQGFKVTPHYQRMAGFRLSALQASPAAAAVFLDNNAVPALGYVIKQPDLAKTLQALAKQGRDGFYQGVVAKQLVQGSRAAGGIWTMQDLQQYEVKLRQPIVMQYQGYTITSAAPPSSGGVAMASIFNMLGTLQWYRLPDLQQKHVLVEAMRRAYRDRAMYLGDTDFVDVPITRLTSTNYANKLAADIQLDAATPSHTLPGVDTQAKGQHTTHFSILDKAGNRVSATLSVNYPFGSGFVAPGTGVLLNDEMDDFSAKPGSPNAYGLVGAQANAIAPRKRMLSSMSPTFVENDQQLAIIGTPGGSRIITMVLHGVLGVIDNQTAQQVVAQPRYHHQYLPDVIQFEKGAFTETEQAKLQSLGHQLSELDNPYGNMQLIILNKKTQQVSAASDPRGEGSAQVQ